VELASQSGIVGRVLPELSYSSLAGGTYTILDDVALRFDPALSDANSTGELRITGHPTGDVVIGVGDAIVSGAGDSVIVQDASTGLFRDDRDAAFGVSSIAVQGARVAVAERLINSSIQIAHLVSGTLVSDSSISLPAATSPALVAWSSSGTRLAIAYHAGSMLRVEVRTPGAGSALELMYEVAADPAVTPALAWDRTEERLAIGTGSNVALWTPGQSTPSPTAAVSVERLGWGPDHVLAIGNASQLALYSTQLEPTGTSFPIGGDFAWSPSDRLAIVDAASVRIAKSSAISNPVTLDLPALPGQLPVVVHPTRVRWVDDTHLVIVTDHGIVGRYTLTVTE
jgi:hypothetical protein